MALRTAFARPTATLLPALAAALLAAGCAGPGASSRVSSLPWGDLPGSAAPLAPFAFQEAPAAGKPQEAPATQQQAPSEAKEGRSVAHVVLLYIPNRLFDLLDIVRARVRVGPGFGFTIRATELADLKLGAWTSVYVGLHGPRLEPSIPWPVGFDLYSGVGVSVLETETSELYYGRGEFGVGLHLLLVGVDVGVDPLEAADFLTGLVTIDLIGDDY